MPTTSLSLSKEEQRAHQLLVLLQATEQSNSRTKQQACYPVERAAKESAEIAGHAEILDIGPLTAQKAKAKAEKESTEST